MRVLIIEDNYDIAANVGDYLELKGHVADFASDGVMGLNLARENAYDVIVLDVNLPRLDGFEVSRQLTESLQISTPILMLTARDSIDDKLQGFHAGALDYLVKPFELKELEVRLEVLVARAVNTKPRELCVGPLKLNLDELVATRAERSLSLHKASLTILACLMRESPKVVSRSELHFLLWGDDAPPGGDPLRSHIHEIRRELDRDEDTKMLKTVRGVGFTLSAPLLSNTHVDLEADDGDLDGH